MPTRIFSLNGVEAEFYHAAVNYSTAIQPYALKLFFGLFLIELLITFIQYTADGQMDPISYLGRFIRQLMGAGFTLAMITYGFSWMMIVIQSFERLGSILTGLPGISPQSIAVTGTNLALMIWNGPSASGIVNAVELAVTQALLGGVVFACFAWIAVEFLLTLVRATSELRPESSCSRFGGNRFTSKASEGYFTAVLSAGVKILFMYVVLGLLMGLAGDFERALLTACKPTATAVPWMTSYFTPPTAIITTVCTGTISLSDMAGYAVLAIMCAGNRHPANERRAGRRSARTRHREDLAAAIYIGRMFGAPASGLASAAVRGGASAAAGGAAAEWRRNHPSEPVMQSFAANVAAEARARNAQQPTQPLNPFNGQAPGYNMRPPAGPSLPPGNGSGGAASLNTLPDSRVNRLATSRWISPTSRTSDVRRADIGNRCQPEHFRHSRGSKMKSAADSDSPRHRGRLGLTRMPVPNPGPSQRGSTWPQFTRYRDRVQPLRVRQTDPGSTAGARFACSNISSRASPPPPSVWPCFMESTPLRSTRM